MKEVIQFKKERDLGEILGDTFKFLRLNGKDLFGYIIRYAGPALLLMVLGLVVYTQSISSEFSTIGIGSTSNTVTFTFLGALLVMLFGGLAYYALLYGIVNHYVKSYINNNGIVNKEDVITGVKNDFWSLVGLNFLVGLMVGIGALFCFLPGIYFGIILVGTCSIFVMERRDISDTIRYSFQLLKGEWWMTFATMFVMGLLYYVVVIVFQIPQYIYFFFKAFVAAETVGINPADMFDWGYTIINAIGMVFQYLAYTIMAVTTVFVYYNLNEKKNQTGTIETIENLGATTDTSQDDNDQLIRY